MATDSDPVAPGAASLSEGAKAQEASIKHVLGHFVGDEPPPPEAPTEQTKGFALGLAIRRMLRPTPLAENADDIDERIWFRQQIWRMLLVAALCVSLLLLGAAAIAVARMVLDAPDEEPIATTVQDPEAEAGQPAATPGNRWYFTNSAGLGLYTIALQGDGTAGTVDVIEDTTDAGTFTWNSETLTIDFTRKLTMDDGYVVTDPWRFECTGTRESAEMECTTTVQQWAYSGRDGFEVRGTNSWPSIAVPR